MKHVRYSLEEKKAHYAKYKALIEKGMTQFSAARKVGVSVESLKQWGRRLDVTQEIHDVLAEKTEEFLSKENSPPLNLSSLPPMTLKCITTRTDEPTPVEVTVVGSFTDIVKVLAALAK